MIAASNAQAIARGDYQLVLGELHAATCSLNAWLFLAQCPEREQLFADLDADLLAPRTVFLEPKDLVGLTARTRRAHFSQKDFFVLPPGETVPLPGRSVVAMSELEVAEVDGVLTVSSRDGRLRCEIVDFFGDLLSAHLATEFSLLAPRPHWPRITVDRMVMWRESWRFAAEELDFAHAREGAERFLAAQRWRLSQALPSRVFVRVPVEQKPFYVDFASPIYVDLLARAVRRTVEAAAAGLSIQITEMLPGTGQVWLPDAEGRVYSSELRVRGFTPSSRANTCRDMCRASRVSRTSWGFMGGTAIGAT